LSNQHVALLLSLSSPLLLSLYPPLLAVSLLSTSQQCYDLHRRERHAQLMFSEGEANESEAEAENANPEVKKQ
jgi:hypothetical protein